MVGIFTFCAVNLKNINRKNFINVGEKKLVYLVNAGCHRGRANDNYYITVLCDGKLIEINYLKNNKAYDILKLLLDPYPVKKEVLIPIEIYVHKNKVYADLDSVDLTKVEGYEEAKKAVEEIYGE